MGLWLSTLLQCGQTRLQGQQNSFKNLNQRALDSTVSPGQTAPQLGSAGEQSHWFGLLLGHCRYELDLPCSMCWPSSSLLSQSHSQYLGPADSPEIPTGETKDFQEVTQNARGRLLYPLGSVCPLQEPEAQLVPCCPGGGAAMQGTCSPFSHPSSAVCPCLWSAGLLQLNPLLEDSLSRVLFLFLSRC